MAIREAIYHVLHNVQDPDLLESIVDLGLVYDVRLDAARAVTVDLTLATPHCPRGGEIVQAVDQVVRAVPGVAAVDVRLVWEPPWTPYRMADHLKAPLGLPAREPPPPAPSESAARRLFRRLVQR